MTALPHEAPSVTGCGFVVERRQDGRCVKLVYDELCRFPLGMHERSRMLGYGAAVGQDGALVEVESWPLHAYLGPVEATCGHPESEHAEGAWLAIGNASGYDWHAFTEAP